MQLHRKQMSVERHKCKWSGVNHLQEHPVLRSGRVNDSPHHCKPAAALILHRPESRNLIQLAYQAEHIRYTELAAGAATQHV